MNASDIEKLAAWSEPKEIQTKYGARLLRKAAVTHAFSDAWRAHKDEVKALGAGFSKNQDGEWELSWWQQLSAEVKQARAEAVEQSRAASAEIDLPKPDGLEYMPFQKAGIRYGLSHPNVLIGDEMGLGKTIQAIGMINADPAVDTVLVVCPKSLKLNWARELRKWLTRPLSVGVVDGRWPDTDIAIINYEGLRKWSEFISMRTWGALIVDECHLIKNKKTQRSMNVKAIKARRNIRMTGTPIVNRPVELWNIIEDLAPDQFGKFWSFAKRYCNANNTGWGWDFAGASNLDELQRRLRETIMVRRLKSEVLTELPRKIRQVIELPAESSEQKAAVRRERSFSDESDDRMASLRAAVELSKAEGEDAYKQAVKSLQDASQVDFTEMSRLRHDTALSKVGAVIAHAQECLEDNDNKLVIFAHHIDVVHKIEAGLAEFNPVILIGGMKETERDASVTTFQTNPRCRVFIGGITAAGVGITLTAASLAVFAELDWVPGNVTQCEDRIHRIGQLETCLIQHIVLEESLDARMAKTLVEKQEVIDKALDVNHPERTQPVYTPKAAPATTGTSPQKLDEEGAKLTDEQVAEIHGKLRALAGMDGDFAAELNGAGFNKIDTLIGHSLAEQGRLTWKQAALGLRIIKKYHNQIGDVSWTTTQK